MPTPPKVPVDIKVSQLDGSTKLFQSFCKTQLRFELEYNLKRGTTTNCYLLADGNNSLLIDVPRAEYLEIFADAIAKEAVCVDTIVLTHLSPDIVKTLAEVLRTIKMPESGKITLILSNPALKVLNMKLSEDPDSQKLLELLEVRVPKGEQEVITVGRRQLVCVPTSTPRYPDMLCIYERATSRLFSACLFSAHVNPQQGVLGTDGVDRGGWSVYGNDWKYFFDCMFAPVAKQTSQALKRLGIVSEASESGKPLLQKLGQLFSSQSDSSASQGMSMPIKTILPRHGPIVQQGMTQLVREYSRWVDIQIKNGATAKVAVLYASAYGNTAALAQAISRGITKAGVGAEMVNLEELSLSECEAIIADSQGFVIGSPTLGGHLPTQVSAMLGSIMRSNDAKNLPCGVFGSYGWSGESVDILRDRLTNAGFQAAFPPIKVQFRPDAKALQICEESGTDLAQVVLKSKRRSAKSQTANSSGTSMSTATDAQQAMGRVVGSLSVVTAKSGEAESAMLASWISQASFDPPGLTVAVKKDRAIENLMEPGAAFNVNILGEGSEKAIMKAVLKPFAPGEFRFTDIPHERSEETGCVVLTDAVSLLECTVSELMDAGDHWIVYGVISKGRVLNEGKLSSVHHRRDGTNY